MTKAKPSKRLTAGNTMKTGGKAKPSISLLELRKQTGLNQHDFWARVACTQSGGSRYENGRPVSRAVALLLAIAYGSDSARAKTIDALVTGK